MTVTATAARAKLCRLKSREKDGRATQETLHLLSIPGMRDSISRGLKTPLSTLAKKPGW